MLFDRALFTLGLSLLLVGGYLFFTHSNLENVSASNAQVESSQIEEQRASFLKKKLSL